MAVVVVLVIVLGVIVVVVGYRDRRSTLRSNLTRLQNLTGLDPWVKATRREVPELDFWRPLLLQKLFSTRSTKTKTFST